jgi:hypothetical protein
MASEQRLKSVIRHAVLKVHKAFNKKAQADRPLTNLEKAEIITDAVYGALSKAQVILIEPEIRKIDPDDLDHP